MRSALCNCANLNGPALVPLPSGRRSYYLPASLSPEGATNAPPGTKTGSQEAPEPPPPLKRLCRRLGRSGDLRQR